MQFFYDDKFNLGALLTKMIKCQLVENGLVKISNDNIISTNPMLQIITYHEYPYFMPSGSNDVYQIRCGISQGVVYDCLLISESAIRLLVNEFETVSKLDLGNDGKAVNYDLISQYPILGHIQSSKFAYNTIYQKLHQHLAILYWLPKAGEDSMTSKANQNNNKPTEIDIKYVFDCFKPQDNMDAIQKFLKLGILLHILFMVADSMMYTYSSFVQTRNVG